MLGFQLVEAEKIDMDVEKEKGGFGTVRTTQRNRYCLQ